MRRRLFRKKYTGDINLDFVLDNGLTLGEALKTTAVPQSKPLRPSQPGGTLGELMEEGGISVKRCARRCKLAEDTIQGVLDGWLPIDADIAAGLARGFKLRQDFWLRRERSYQESLAYYGETRPEAPESAKVPVAH